MKRVLVRGSIFIILLVLPILLVDYYVDAYVSFRLTYDKIGRIGIESNYSVGDDIPQSERKAKWAKILHMNPVGCIILGSSRSMLFSSENLKKNSFYNLAVSGGCSVNDYMAETYILYQHEMLPEAVLIEITPGIFNANAGHSKWREWGNSSEYMKSVLEGKQCNNDDSYLLGVQYTDIISPAYFRYNLKQLIKGNRSYIKIHDLSDDETLPTQHIDGSYAYSREYQVEKNEETIDKDIDTVSKNHSIMRCSDYDRLDVQSISNFEGLVEFLIDEGINVSFYLPPYSERLYDNICNDPYYDSILEVENYVLKYAKNNDLQVYGSYNPQYCDITSKDLYDVYHIKSDRIVDTLLFPRNSNADLFWIEKIKEDD